MFYLLRCCLSVRVKLFLIKSQNCPFLVCHLKLCILFQETSKVTCSFFSLAWQLKFVLKTLRNFLQGVTQPFCSKLKMYEVELEKLMRRKMHFFQIDWIKNSEKRAFSSWVIDSQKFFEGNTCSQPFHRGQKLNFYFTKLPKLDHWGPNIKFSKLFFIYSSSVVICEEYWELKRNQFWSTTVHCAHS